MRFWVSTIAATLMLLNANTSNLQAETGLDSGPLVAYSIGIGVIGLIAFAGAEDRGTVVHGPPDVAGDLDGVHGGAQVLGERALDGTLEPRLEAVEQTHQRTSSVWAQVGSGLARLSAGAGRFLNGAARTVDG